MRSIALVGGVALEEEMQHNGRDEHVKSWILCDDRSSHGAQDDYHNKVDFKYNVNAAIMRFVVHFNNKFVGEKNVTLSQVSLTIDKLALNFSISINI